MNIALSRVHFPVTALGPGRRLGIWFQGCSIRCPGCISGDTWRFSAHGIEVQQVVEQLQPWLEVCDGVTISGGEPFDQPEALVQLLQRVSARRQTNVLVYSGHAVEDINPVLQRAQGLIDALISDPYQPKQPQTMPLRGSDNQRLHLLTPLGVALFSRYECAAVPLVRHLDVMFDEDGTAWLTGIPHRGDLPRLQELLVREGHQAHTSQVPETP
jgi:anaerobic ribonucleoside-triphosphate reductase activating protein